MRTIKEKSIYFKFFIYKALVPDYFNTDKPVYGLLKAS